MTVTALQSVSTEELAREMQALGRAARDASRFLAKADSTTKDKALRAAAKTVRRRAKDILSANAADMNAADSKNLSPALLDRLKLDKGRVEAIAEGLETVAALPDPVGDILAEWERPNGLKISRVRVPLGVIGVIYESRPNVTADAGGLCLKAGNAAILRGGSESRQSSLAIADCLHVGLDVAGLPQSSIQLVPTTERAAVGLLLKMSKFIDVIVPRGGPSLIDRVQRESRIPVFAHLEGLCHVYIDGAADEVMARAIVLNAKMRRAAICGAAETLLVDRAVAKSQLPAIIGDLIAAGCTLRGDEATRAIDPRVEAAMPADWDTEYLDAILSIRVVDGLSEAIKHINQHGSHHTDSIVTEDAAAAERFLAEVDSGIVLWNASTQFADGGEFGMGAEIGISTGKLHARGPVGAEQLTSYKYMVRGAGQIRP